MIALLAIFAFVAACNGYYVAAGVLLFVAVVFAD